MIERKPPIKIPQAQEFNPSIFLAGSIEMGAATNWQEQVRYALKDSDVVLYNPRRDDWDASWKQTMSDEQFTTQVLWELNALEKADMILMYLDPQTKSPISLLELGLFARSGKLAVVCPEGFWRKGNVDIVCTRYNVFRFTTLEEAINYAKSLLNV